MMTATLAYIAVFQAINTNPLIRVGAGLPGGAARQGSGEWRPVVDPKTGLIAANPAGREPEPNVTSGPLPVLMMRRQEAAAPPASPAPVPSLAGQIGRGSSTEVLPRPNQTASNPAPAAPADQTPRPTERPNLGDIAMLPNLRRAGPANPARTPAPTGPQPLNPASLFLQPRDGAPPKSLEQTQQPTRGLLPPVPQPEPTQNPNPKPENPPAKPETKPTPTPANNPRLVSIDVVDLEVSKVLQSLSEQVGMNLVLLSLPNRNLTLRLSKVEIDEALQHICAIAGLRFITIGKTSVIATPEELQRAYPKEYEAKYPAAPVAPVEPPPAPAEHVTEILTLSFASAHQIATALKSQFDEKELKAIVGPGQHIPALGDAKAEQVTGVQTGLITNERQSGGGDEVDLTARTLVLNGTASAVKRAATIAKALDVARPQVGIQVQIIDISNDSMRDLGMTWNFSDQNITERDAGGINFRSFDRSPLSFNATIAALQRNDKARIMAQPNINVLDNQRAFILIGQRLNFPTVVGFTANNTPIFSPKEERVGIYLQVAASVSPNGEITMALYPQVSTVTSFLEVNGGSYPQIATREAQTTLRVRSGETIILGGLIRDSEIKNVQKVPLLGDIPILGEFFRKTKTEKISSQVIISITPTIIPPSSNAPR